MEKSVIVLEKTVTVEELLFKSFEIIPLAASAMRVSKSDVRRLIKHGGLKYKVGDEFRTLKEDEIFGYGNFIFKYGKHHFFRFDSRNLDLK